MDARLEFFDIMPVESTDLLIVGCGPAGATAAREAARAGVRTLVLERDPIVGERRVCAAGLRPGFCRTFDLPESVVHCDTPRLALFDADGVEHELFFGPGHTSTREELDGAIAGLAAREGAEIRTRALFRGIERDDRHRAIVEYADLALGRRRKVVARTVFFALGASARLEDPSFGKIAMPRWRDGLLTTLQYRVYLDRPWNVSGYGEMLAVVLPPAGFTSDPETTPAGHPLKNYVTQWGADPVWDSDIVPDIV